MFYIDLYFPKVAQGMNVRLGRYISLSDFEAQLGPNNYTYTHSLTYTYDCYTQTGANVTLKLSDHRTVQGAFLTVAIPPHGSRTPNVSNPAGTALTQPNANRAICNELYEVTSYTPEWSILNDTNRQLGKKDFINFRNEFFDDIKGQRTGFKSKYSEHALSWNHWISSTVVLRPELRWEHAYNSNAYDSGARHSQFMFAADVVWYYQGKGGNGTN